MVKLISDGGPSPAKVAAVTLHVYCEAGISASTIVFVSAVVVFVIGSPSESVHVTV